ncbi:DsbA family oxidoreductase [Microbacterium sp. X-17]|uniref:DsbA family oxidoreductase n=1 Tax=Microbacterium sp. X-17 TaxID=3144404 RepID=UPI0031F4FAD6
MKVELWEDIVCSWCGIMNERVNTAVARFAHRDELELQHRSFRLLPELPDGVGYDFAEFFAAQRGTPRAESERMAAQIEEIAHADGIPRYHVAGNSIGNTTLAHEFLAYASAEGAHQRAWDTLFRANFGDKAELWTVDDLLAFAAPLDLDEAGAREALESRRFRAQVEADHAEAQALGARGVPFLVVDRKYGMSGAQSVDTILELLDQAWAERDATVGASR